MESLQNNLENTFRSIEACPILDGHMLEGVELGFGDNHIPHKLDRGIRGWFITRIKGPARYGGIVTDAYPSGSTIVTLRLYENNTGTEPMDSFLSLYSNAVATVDLWVF
jgi:hypothetical protein